LGQRLGELCGHYRLETDIALTNISLDLFGQTRSYYQYAAKLKGGDATEDTVAFLRSEREYINVLLVEQPNTNFAYSIARQFLFDAFHLLLLEELQNSNDKTLAAIAKKASRKCVTICVSRPIGSSASVTEPQKAIKKYKKP
jgi:ring-1,2-phenylacetyl-CoA epoxidase subunit PaaC